jgi:AraC family transcriptional regulator, regulatory protein of adaptative response / methylated-DNA-[protein]-cysteine methyltransferase
VFFVGNEFESKKQIDSYPILSYHTDKRLYETINERIGKQNMHEENYWQAVLARDSRSNGTFVYAVRSTGIYCNPSCPSRRPQRDQVIFFPVPEAAEQAGFRPCRRCRPEETAKPESQVELVRRACRYIEKNLDSPPSLASLSAQVHLSPYHLQRIFKRIMGITPRQYAEACRLGRLKAQLKDGEPVTRALYDVGYGSSSRLYERAPSQLGMTPTAYRRGGPGMHINYTIVDCPLGRLLVAATAKGICAVSLSDNDAVLESALFSEYPAAEITRDGVNLSQWVNALMSHLNGQQPHIDLPVDVQATAFEWRVWQELQAIPYGSTRSYSQIAQALGQPKATRAVARACATNPVPLVIPCHRVVREDGTLGGYRWGLERKQQLLAKEANVSQREKVRQSRD